MERWNDTRRSRVLLALLILVSLAAPLHAVKWLPFGPDGGDARSFAADPKDPAHLYLGTTTGWIYESRDSARSWKRLAQLAQRDDLVIDHIQVDRSDPSHLLAGVWVLGRVDGGLFQSKDAGKTWAESPDLKGQSVRALAGAPSDPKVFVAGTLEGVYRTNDGGEHWKLISPPGSKEIHEVESVALDPKDAQTIYAGTWHLPWKTSDGGQTWSNIKEGVIDDSDVFSIIVDPKDSNTVYASACSGIYKSDSAGAKFQKVQGIPSTARRTRVLMQDPQHLDTVYAGTTEGFFRTTDSGKTWVRTTGPELIVNDVFVDPSDTNHIVLATDRGGVLASRDGGTSFQPANSGYSVRQVVSYVADARRPSTVYVGVVNDKEWGGVFESTDGALSWAQQSAGLGGRDVFSLAQASDGTVIAGTSHGIYRLQDSMWARVDDVDMTARRLDLHRKVGPSARRPIRKETKPRAGARSKSSARAATSAQPKKPAGVQPPVRGFDGSVFAIESFGDVLYAATSQGLLSSRTAGTHWNAVGGVAPQEYHFVAATKNVVAAASLTTIVRSTDGGATWSGGTLPPKLTQVTALAADDSGQVWIGGREGVWFSQDGGGTWQMDKNIFLQDVNNIFYDAPTQRILVTLNASSHLVYAFHLPDHTVRFWDAGWDLRFARSMGDHLVGATRFDGMVIQPRMVDSAELAHQ